MATFDTLVNMLLVKGLVANVLFIARVTELDETVIEFAF